MSSNAEMTIRVVVAGAAGRMGATVCEAVRGDPELFLVAAADPAWFDEGGEHSEEVPFFTDLEAALAETRPDVCVDFTTAEAARGNIEQCIEKGVHAVVGTTGFGERDLDEIRELSETKGTPVLLAPNFALGAVLMMQFAVQAARHFEACEIVELHHPGKKDAPSGTAKRTGELVESSWREEAGRDAGVPLHSVRLPGLVAHQEVIFGGSGQTLTIRHDSLSRESFMPGVLLAVKKVAGLQGLVVGLENIL